MADINKMIADLRQEREYIEESLLSLERLARGRGKRRGRPPKWLTEGAVEAKEPKKRRGRPPGPKKPNGEESGK